MSCNEFYVYQYLNENNIPFYIGKGSKNRINENHSPWLNIPPVEYRKIIKANLSEKDAFDLELDLIKQYGRKLDGGLLDNIKLSRWVSQAGWEHSQEAKDKISKANTGKVRTEAHKQNYRNPKTVEHAENIRKANLGRKDDGRYLKTSQTMKGKPWSEARRLAQLAKASKEI